MLTWPSLISWHWSHFARVYICEWRLWDLLSYTTILYPSVWYYNTKMSVMGIQRRYWGCKVEASAKAKNIRVIKMMEVPLLLPSYLILSMLFFLVILGESLGNGPATSDILLKSDFSIFHAVHRIEWHVRQLYRSNLKRVYSCPIQYNKHAIGVWAF